MKWILSSLMLTTLSAHGSECEFDLTQLRDQSYQKLSLAESNSDGEVVDGFRDFQFGYEMKNQLTDKKIKNLCENERFQMNYKEVLRCTEDLYSVVSPQSIEKVKLKGKDYLASYKALPISKWKFFNYCHDHQNQMAQIHSEMQKTKSCLEGVKLRLSHNSVLGKSGQSVLSMARNYDELFDYCQTPKFQESFAKLDINDVKQCFTQKMENTHVMTSYNYGEEFKKLWQASQSGKKKFDKNLNLSQWQTAINNSLVFNDFVAPAVVTYLDCAQTFIKGKNLYAFYGDHKFVNCMGESHENAKDAQIHCAGVSPLYSQTESKWTKPKKASRSVASNRPEYELKSFFGEWQNSNFH